MQQLPMQVVTGAAPIFNRRVILAALKFRIDRPDNPSASPAADHSLHLHSGTGCRHHTIVTIASIFTKLS